MQKKISRRNFLKLSGSALVAAAGSYGVANYLHNALWPVQVKVSSLADLPPAPFCGPPQSTEALLVDLAQAAGGYDLFFAGTDGWAHIPPASGKAPYHPDTAAPEDADFPAGLNTYLFGFANLNGIDQGEIDSQKMKVQYPAPMFWFDQDQEFRVRLTNLGLGMRPDLIDEHTIHFHGRDNVIPFFDGEPNTSVAVPIGRFFDYVFKVDRPGTYMYHCHVEEVEHIHLGMTGMVFVNSAQNGESLTYQDESKPYTKFAYECKDVNNNCSTGYNREFAMLLTEVWAEAHWDFSHVQLPEWSDYKADYYALNGRVYPDTLEPNGYVNASNPKRAGNDLAAPPGREELKYQPYSSLVTCNAGERVLLRLANLGYTRQTMTLAGIKMRVVGKDATLLRSRTGADLSYLTDSIGIGPGESFDIIFEAPAHSGNGSYDTYLLYNRNFSGTNSGGAYGGQMTEIRVYPNGIPAQPLPNINPTVDDPSLWGA